MERLHKFLAAAGIDSRRRCEELITSGRVAVNGEIITSLGTKVDPLTDKVTLDGKPVDPLSGHIYLVMNKPPGFITTVKDTHNRPTVVDLIPGIDRRLYPVGRLDMDSQGLLIMTDDGDVAFALTHPSREIAKTYVARVRNKVSDEDMIKLKIGVELDDGVTLPSHCRFLDDSRQMIEIQIREGRNRQVRRMFEALSNEVITLIRIKMGPISLGELKKGAYRHLTSTEVAEIKKLTHAINTRSDRKINNKIREVAPDGNGHSKVHRKASDTSQSKVGLHGQGGTKKPVGEKKKPRVSGRGSKVEPSDKP